MQLSNAFINSKFFFISLCQFNVIHAWPIASRIPIIPIPELMCMRKGVFWLHSRKHNDPAIIDFLPWLMTMRHCGSVIDSTFLVKLLLLNVVNCTFWNRKVANWWVARFLEHTCIFHVPCRHWRPAVSAASFLLVHVHHTDAVLQRHHSQTQCLAL